MGNFTTGSSFAISADSLFRPLRVLPFVNGQGVYISSGNRVLGYSMASTTASVVYGQMGSFTIPPPSSLSADTLNGPSGLSFGLGGGLYIADGNNRVLYFTGGDRSFGSTTASRVYGQLGSFTTSFFDSSRTTADTLIFPEGVTDTANGPCIADSVDRRVLCYPGTSTTATQVFGQMGNMSTNVQNNGGVSADSLGDPSAVTLSSGGNGILVVDRQNNRVLLFVTATTSSTTTSTTTAASTITPSSGAAIARSILFLHVVLLVIFWP
jgi:hypothetical protein